MNTVHLIALNTFRQIVRQKVFYNVVLFGLGMVLLSMLAGNITFGYPDRVVRSIGLSGISLALDLLALLTGVGLIHDEIDRKSIYVILTRPVGRGQYVAGRLIGLLTTLTLIAVGLLAVFAVVLTMAHGSLSSLDALAVLGSLAEASVLASIAVVFSAFTTPTLGAGMGIGVWIVAATSDDLVGLSAHRPELLRLAQAISYVFPNFARLNFRESAVYAVNVPISTWLAALVLAGLYTVICASLASVILSRRELL